MIKTLLNKMGYIKKTDVPEEPKKERKTYFSTHPVHTTDTTQEKIERLWEHNFSKSVHPQMTADSADNAPAMAMDSIRANYSSDMIIPDTQVLWFASQSFIGYQLCALIAQNWLISKACLMPAKDATRKGFEISVNDGRDIDPEILDAIRKEDVRYKLNKNLIQFIQMGRVFGVRVAMFIIDSDDPDYYSKPFNPDGILPGSYRGISQIDPYWLATQLDAKSAGDPASIDFYEPTYWIINGKNVHKSHLVIFRTEEVADILKPTYRYGGIPIPQKIAERVYAAERTANEAPLLTLTKRVDVVNADMAQATAQYPAFEERMQQWVNNRDNYGIKFLGLDEDMKQFDTSLADLDDVIMTQFQLVASAANVPAVKLLGTSPKGFNATGEFEEANYHEELESMQTHDLSPLVERHHLILIRSEIAPRFGIEPFNTTITWNKLDAMTAKEQAEVNRTNAETGKFLIESGAIDSEEERQRVMADPSSGYVGLAQDPINDPENELEDFEGA